MLHKACSAKLHVPRAHAAVPLLPACSAVHFGLRARHAPSKHVSMRAVPNDTESQQGLDPLLEAAVPRDQRPVNELTQLQEVSDLAFIVDGRAVVKATCPSKQSPCQHITDSTNASVQLILS